MYVNILKDIISENAGPISIKFSCAASRLGGGGWLWSRMYGPHPYMVLYGNNLK